MAVEAKMAFSREVIVSASLDDKNGILLLSFRGSRAFVSDVGKGRHNPVFDDLCRKASSAVGKRDNLLSLETEDLFGMKITFAGVFKEGAMTGASWEITKVHHLEVGEPKVGGGGANVEDGVCRNLCIDSGLCAAFSEYMDSGEVSALCGNGSCPYFRQIGSLCEGCHFGMSVLADDEYCCAENTALFQSRECCGGSSTEGEVFADGYRYIFWRKTERCDCRNISPKKVIELYGSNWIAEKTTGTENE